MSRVGSRSQASSRGNKLGYYRASQACDFCRRRKSRCVAAVDQNETRCATCTRLGRQCIVVTVDKMPQVHTLTRQSPRTISAPYENLQKIIHSFDLSSDEPLNMARCPPASRGFTTKSMDSPIHQQETIATSSLDIGSYEQWATRSTLCLADILPNETPEDQSARFQSNYLALTFPNDPTLATWRHSVLAQGIRERAFVPSNSGHLFLQDVNSEQVVNFSSDWMPN